MNWLPTSPQAWRSDCGQYETRGCYVNGSYAFRARVVATDVLVASSADRGYVERCVERHAADALREAT